jgi:SAM-dependent methyltransferase
MTEGLGNGLAEGVATTWHHGLIARWWANFNLDGPEIDYFGSLVSHNQPALDVGCGNGRLLVPWVAAGFDVDGVDASADMIEGCRTAARNVGRSPALYVQPTHLLQVARQYKTIISCGTFGLGGTRATDVEGLRRMRSHLLSDGVLAIDYEVKEWDSERWRKWQPRPADTSAPPDAERRLGPDGFHYALRHRITGVDQVDRSVSRELQAWQWQGDTLIAREAHALVINVYTSQEIVSALHSAGFTTVEVQGGYHGGPPTESDAFHVFIATG